MSGPLLFWVQDPRGCSLRSRRYCLALSKQLGLGIDLMHALIAPLASFASTVRPANLEPWRRQFGQASATLRLAGARLY